LPCFASSENCEKSGNIIYIRRKKEEGKRKKEVRQDYVTDVTDVKDRRKKKEGRTKKEERRRKMQSWQ